MLLEKAAAVAAAALGIGGRTGVETLGDEKNLSKEFFGRSEFSEGLQGEPELSSLPWVTTATIGRLGRLLVIVRLREGGTASESVAAS